MTIGLLGLCIVLIVLDVVWNKDLYDSQAYGNNKFYSADNDTVSNVNQNMGNGDGTNTNVNSIETAYTIIPDILASAGIRNTTVEEVKKGKDIFGMRFDALEGIVTKKYIYQDGFPLAYAYELNASIGYENVKRLIEEKASMSPVWKINETNSFGKRSIYLNNSNKIDTTYVLIEFTHVIIGFEYPKSNHVIFEPLFEHLKLIF